MNRIWLKYYLIPYLYILIKPIFKSVIKLLKKCSCLLSSYSALLMYEWSTFDLSNVEYIDILNIHTNEIPQAITI